MTVSARKAPRVLADGAFSPVPGWAIASRPWATRRTFTGPSGIANVEPLEAHVDPTAHPDLGPGLRFYVRIGAAEARQMVEGSGGWVEVLLVTDRMPVVGATVYAGPLFEPETPTGEVDLDARF